MRLTSPAGEMAELVAAVIPATAVVASTARLIVLEEGQLRGRKTQESKDGQSFIDKEGDL